MKKFKQFLTLWIAVSIIFVLSILPIHAKETYYKYVKKSQLNAEQLQQLVKVVPEKNNGVIYVVYEEKIDKKENTNTISTSQPKDRPVPKASPKTKQPVETSDATMYYVIALGIVVLFIHV